MGKEGVMVYCPVCGLMTAPYRYPVHICTKYKEGQVVSRVKKAWNYKLSVWEVAEDETKDARSAENTAEAEKAAYSARDAKDNAGQEFDQEKRELSWQEYLAKRPEDRAATGTAKESAKESLTGYQSCGITTDGHPRACVCMACRPSYIKTHTDNCGCFDCYKWKKEKGINVTYAGTGYGHYSHGQYSANSYTYVPVKPWEGLDRKKWPNTFMTLLRLYYDSSWYHGKTIPDSEYRDRILHGKYAKEPKYGSYYTDNEEYWHGMGGVD